MKPFCLGFLLVAVMGLSACAPNKPMDNVQYNDWATRQNSQAVPNR